MARLESTLMIPLRYWLTKTKGKSTYQWSSSINSFIPSDFLYVERVGSDKLDFMYHYNLTEYPKEIQKKITLLSHFKNFLEGESMNIELPNEDKSTVSNSIYVKKVQALFIYNIIAYH